MCILWRKNRMHEAIFYLSSVMISRFLNLLISSRVNCKLGLKWLMLWCSDRRCFFGSCVTFNVELLFHYAIEKQFSVGFSYSLCFYNLGHSFLSNVWWWQGAPDSKLMAFTLNSKFFLCLFSNGRGHLSCSSNTNPVPVTSSAWNNPAYTQRLLLSSLSNVTPM